MRKDVDPLQVVRNTRTLTAYRVRSAAAQQLAMPFLMLPGLLSFVPVVVARLVRHGSVWLYTGLRLLWLFLMASCFVYGDHRRRRYLSRHPLTVDAETLEARARWSGQ